MSDTLALGRIPLDDYAELLGAGEIEELRALAKPLRGRSIQMVNSTAVGGGVAEILIRLVPLAEELDLNIKWEVMSGGEDFFEVTKAFHNALHGAPYHASQKDFDIFLAYNQRIREKLRLRRECRQTFVDPELRCNKCFRFQPGKQNKYDQTGAGKDNGSGQCINF